MLAVLYFTDGGSCRAVGADVEGQEGQHQHQLHHHQQHQQGRRNLQQTPGHHGSLVTLTGRSKHFGKAGLFEHIGSTSLFQTPQTSWDTLAWLRALPRNASTATGTAPPAVFRHMRKAGGSTVRKFLERNRDRQSVYGSSVAIEWGTFPVPCFEIAPPGTLFVTALRDPIERAFSEFRYGGAGKHLRTDNSTVLHEWMRPNTQAMKELTRGLKRGIYLDNYYCRALTGRCLPRKYLDRIDSASPCLWGGAYGGGCRPEDIDRPVDEGMYALAEAVLGRFDMCLVLEWFDKPAMKDWLFKKLGSPAAALKNLGWERTSYVFGGNTYDMSQKSRKLLKRDNAHDAALYGACKKQTLDSMKELNVELNFEAPKGGGLRGPFRVVETFTVKNVAKNSAKNAGGGGMVRRVRGPQYNNH